MRRKFETRASSLFSNLSTDCSFQVEIPLPEDHLLESISYSASSKVETLLHIEPEELSKIVQEYSNDLFFRGVLEELWEGSIDRKPYVLSPDNLILFQDSSGRQQLCVPSSMRKELIQEIHDSITGTAHAGFERTYACISNLYYWP